MKRGAWVPYLALSLVVIALLPISDGDLSNAIHYDVVTGTAALAALAGALLLHRQNLAPWLLMALGLTLWLVGDIIWDIYEIGLNRDPFPSPADGFYLLGYSSLAASLFLLAHQRATGPDRAGMIDAAIISLGIGTVIWAIAGDPLVEGTSGWELVFTAAYPLADILLLGALMRFLLTRAHAAATWMIGAGLASTLVSDLLLAYRTSTGTGFELIEDWGWMLGATMIATAILHPSSKALETPAPSVSETLSDVRLALLAAASLIAPVTAIILETSGESKAGIVIDAAAVALFGLVVLRMAGLTRAVQDQAVMLSALARTDPLTGAGNRLAWNEALPIELSRSERLSTPVCIAMLDLDHFKKFNDELGHQRGDDFLRLCIEHWRNDLRSIDHLARYGGEEFAVILPGCVLEDAVQIIERMRARVPFDETCSAGVAMWDGTESVDALTRRADDALYAAKSAGRNRSVAAGMAF